MTEHSAIRIMIVAGHPAVRSALRAFLLASDDLVLVGEALSGSEAVCICSQVRPDVVLLDLAMPEMDSATTMRAIRQAHPQTQVIGLTSFNEDDLVAAALRAGASSYLLKNVTADELATAIGAAKAGTPPAAPEVAQVLIQTLATHSGARQTT